MSLVILLQTWWKGHGTKIIGFGTAAVGALAYIDQQTIHLIETFAGPTHGPHIAQGIMITSGLMTAYRGFTNSKPKE